MPPEVTLYIACFELENFPENLIISAPVSGEKMRVFGRESEVKIKELRIKRKIPAYPPYPVVRSESGTILWLPGIRHSGYHICRPGGQVLVLSAEKV